MSTATMNPPTAPQGSAYVPPVRKQTIMERIRANCPPGHKIAPPMVFLLLQGDHLEEDINTGKEVTYHPGDGKEIVTYSDLEKLNIEGFLPKFQRKNTAEATRIDPFAPSPGETKEQYKARMDEMMARQLSQFDSGNVVLLSATEGSTLVPTGMGTKMNLPATSPSDKPVEQMTEAELRQLAKDEDVDLSKFKGSRDALLRHVKAELKL